VHANPQGLRPDVAGGPTADVIPRDARGRAAALTAAQSPCEAAPGCLQASMDRLHRDRRLGPSVTSAECPDVGARNGVDGSRDVTR